eukprot:2773225-Pleurochrysis_carterae.AAC.4
MSSVSMLNRGAKAIRYFNQLLYGGHHVQSVSVICCQLAFSWLAPRFAARSSSKQTRLEAARSVAGRDKWRAWRDAQRAGATSRVRRDEQDAAGLARRSATSRAQGATSRARA